MTNKPTIYVLCFLLGLYGVYRSSGFFMQGDELRGCIVVVGVICLIAALIYKVRRIEKVSLLVQESKTVNPAFLYFLTVYALLRGFQEGLKSDWEGLVISFIAGICGVIAIIQIERNVTSQFR